MKGFAHFNTPNLLALGGATRRGQFYFPLVLGVQELEVVSGLLSSPREAPAFLFSDDMVLEGQMGPSACVTLPAFTS